MLFVLLVFLALNLAEMFYFASRYLNKGIPIDCLFILMHLMVSALLLIAIQTLLA